MQADLYSQSIYVGSVTVKPARAFPPLINLVEDHVSCGHRLFASRGQTDNRYDEVLMDTIQVVKIDPNLTVN